LDAGDPSASDHLIEQWFAAFERIASMPHLGRPRSELGRRLRSHVVGIHTIFYRPHLHYVEITRVLHQRRNLVQAFASPRRKKLAATPEFERFVWERVESGQYASTDDVLTACMDALAEREIEDHDLEWLREQIRRGEEQHERGEYPSGEEAFARIRERFRDRKIPPHER
jgi:putative addiction module CopG family antidote